MDISIETIVIGAGLTGLTTAYYLKKQNKNFLVIEKADKVGGVIQTRNENNFIYEEGPNTGVVGNTTVVELFESLAPFFKSELALDTAKKRYILKNTKWEALPGGLIDAVRTPLFTFSDKLRVLGEPFRSPGKNPHENLSSFVKRRLGDSFLIYAIDPFILGVYAGDPAYIIPKYALPKLYNLEQNYGSLIGGSVKKMFEKKTPEEKKVSRKVFSFEGGLGSLIHGLYTSTWKDNFILSAHDINISQFEGGYQVIYTNKQGEIKIVKAKNVITTVGAYELEAIIPFIDREKLKKINSLLYTKVIEIVLGFSKWEGMQLDGFGGLIPFIENRNLLGVLFMSSLFNNRAPENGALLSLFMGGVRKQEVMKLSEDELKKMVEIECLELLSLKQFNPDLFKIIWHERAIPQYGLESGERFETVAALEKQYPGLFIGGNLIGGIGMADRIKQGKELAIKSF
jgi:protoporphyrinogen/coproporphyrinogen III oxidase